METDWTALADRCLTAAEPSSELARDLSRPLMPRDDYPEVGTLISFAAANGDVEKAFEIVSALFPGWGCQCGHPLSRGKLE